METQSQTNMRVQMEQWRMMGADPVYERGTVRLPQFKKSFSPELEVTVRDPESGNFAPYLLRSGRPLMCSEVLPERADLALDQDGHMVSQAEFAERYDKYLSAFVGIGDPAFEPVENVARFINAKPDEWSESNGMVEIDFDPRVEVEFKAKKFYGPDGESEEEYMASREENSDMKKMLAGLLKNQEMMSQLIGGGKSDEIIGVTEETLESVGVPIDQVQEASKPDNHEAAPCGKFVKAGYVNQHIHHCKNEACKPGDLVA